MSTSNRKISTPLDEKTLKSLKAGDEVLLSGEIFTARDQAHKRLVETIAKSGKPPIDLKNKIIYYCGPTRTPGGRVIGSCGPTTSSRMDRFTPQLLQIGLKGIIGKGRRSDVVRRSICKHGAVYFLATGGAGAFLSRCVISAKPILFKELGPEAVVRLVVKDFPLIVGIDSKGQDIFKR